MQKNKFRLLDRLLFNQTLGAKRWELSSLRSVRDKMCYLQSDEVASHQNSSHGGKRGGGGGKADKKGVWFGVKWKSDGVFENWRQKRGHRRWENLGQAIKTRGRIFIKNWVNPSTK